MTRLPMFFSLSLLLAACSGSSDTAVPAAATTPPVPIAQHPQSVPFLITEVAKFNEPWAMTFLPDGRLLVTEKRGVLKLVNLDAATGSTLDVAGVPEVAYGGQGGLGDVVLHPRFADTGWVYLSYAEAGAGDTRGAAVARAKLVSDGQGGAKLIDFSVIWRQQPKVAGNGHYGHRIAFGPDGMLWISSGERQQFDPAQDLETNLGKSIRLFDDGAVPQDNPFVDQGALAAQAWTLGHRNPLGLAFDAQGRLWMHEMGPAGGDELNLLERGSNYGWPMVSNGDHYDGRVIPDHDTRPEFNAPEASWNPVIAPAGFIIYSGSEFPDWQGDGFIGGLASKSLVRIEFDGVTAREAERFDMGHRIREVEQGHDGAIWLLEDGADVGLLRLALAH